MQSEETVLRTETLSLIERELSKIRKLADRADEDVLCYLIDLAIAEAKSQARPAGYKETRPTQHRLGLQKAM
jgi:hypothetical protein